jgi:hypothetical protein
MGNLYAKDTGCWERSSPPEHKISNGQCALLKRKLALLDDIMNGLKYTLKF